MADAPATLLSIVVPTLNEEGTLPRLLEDLAPLLARGDVELVVGDGGSTDETLTVVQHAGARLVTTTPGRGAQLRAAITEARGEYLWILHADVRVPAATRDGFAQLATDRVRYPCACRLVIDDASWSLRVIAAGANLRSRWLSLPYGDQGLLISRAQLDAVGGYEDIPLMEDVALALRLRRVSPIRLLRELPVRVSARRWQRDGPWRRSARNLVLLARYLAGADPRGLARAYRATVTS